MALGCVLPTQSLWFVMTLSERNFTGAVYVALGPKQFSEPSYVTEMLPVSDAFCTTLHNLTSTHSHTSRHSIERHGVTDSCKWLLCGLASVFDETSTFGSNNKLHNQNWRIKAVSTSSLSFTGAVRIGTFHAATDVVPMHACSIVWAIRESLVGGCGWPIPQFGCKLKGTVFAWTAPLSVMRNSLRPKTQNAADHRVVRIVVSTVIDASVRHAVQCGPPS